MNNIIIIITLISQICVNKNIIFIFRIKAMNLLLIQNYFFIIVIIFLKYFYKLNFDKNFKINLYFTIKIIIIFQKLKH